MSNTVSVKEFSSKFSTKKEVFDFLSHECKFVLPPKDVTNIYYLRQLATGEKKGVQCDEMKHLNVPYFETLKVESILSWVQLNHPEFTKDYLPLPRDYEKWPRQVSREHITIYHPVF